MEIAGDVHEGVFKNQLMSDVARGDKTQRDTVDENKTMNARIFASLEALTDNELDNFLLLEFPSVATNFTPGMSRDQKINSLLQYCLTMPGELERLARIVSARS